MFFWYFDLVKMEICFQIRWTELLDKWFFFTWVSRCAISRFCFWDSSDLSMIRFDMEWICKLAWFNFVFLDNTFQNLASSEEIISLNLLSLTFLSPLKLIFVIFRHEPILQLNMLQLIFLMVLSLLLYLNYFLNIYNILKWKLSFFSPLILRHPCKPFFCGLLSFKAWVWTPVPGASLNHFRYKIHIGRNNWSSLVSILVPKPYKQFCKNLV